MSLFQRSKNRKCLGVPTASRPTRGWGGRDEKINDFSFYVGRKKSIYVDSGVSAWGTYGMKMGIILAKSWIQTPKEGYDTRSDEFLTFFWKGVGYIILCFCWARSDFCQKSYFLDKIVTKWVAVRPHGLIFNMEGPICRARSDPSVKKMSRPHF